MTIRHYQQNQPIIGARTWIDPSAMLIGKVILGEDCSIWPMVVIRGDVHNISIGDRTNIQDGTICHVTHAGPYNPNGFALILGRNITVGHRVILHGCTIEDNCLIGMGSIIMDGAIIQSEVIVGAGSLVPPGKVLTPGLWVGNPVLYKRPLRAEEIAFMGYSAQTYIDLKNNYIKI